MTDLTAQEALDIWGPINQQQAKEKAERGGFWKPADGELRGTIERVHQTLNFEKTGMVPTLDVRNAQGAVVVARLDATVIRNKVSEKMPVKGDVIAITNVSKGDKRYWNADVEVLRDGKPVDGANQSEPPF